MLNIKILCVGKVKNKDLSSLISEYKKMISKYAKLDILELEDEKFPTNLSKSDIYIIKEKESNKIIDKIKKINKPYIISLDLNGTKFTSINFAKEIEKISIKGYSNIIFVIGGSLGISDELLSICNDSICFSTLTFPHQLIRLFLCEQIFRSFKILNNETYHH